MKKTITCLTNNCVNAYRSFKAAAGFIFLISPSPTLRNTSMFLSSVTYCRRMWDTWEERKALYKHLSELLLSTLVSRHSPPPPPTAEYHHVFTRRNRAPCRVPASGAESEELREANVNNCKPIKITLHLSLDLYWVAFQFSSVRLSECLEGLGRPVRETQFHGAGFFFPLCFVFPAGIEACDTSLSGDPTENLENGVSGCFSWL